MYKALIIGCGKIAGGGSVIGAGTHAGALSADGRFSFVGGVDSNFQKPGNLEKGMDAKHLII